MSLASPSGGTVLTAKIGMDALMAIESSTILPQALIHVIELQRHLMGLETMTECSVLLDYHLGPATHLRFKLQIIKLMFVVQQLFTQPTPLPHRVSATILLCIECKKFSSPDLGFLLDGQLYPNNSVVTVTDIGSSFFMSALFCLTPRLECCSDSETPNAASVTREWYQPDGRPVTSANSPFIRTQASSAVSLHNAPFSSTTPPSGVFHCEIPDASGTSQSIYVGIYPQGVGKIKNIL